MAFFLIRSQFLCFNFNQNVVFVSSSPKSSFSFHSIDDDASVKKLPYPWKRKICYDNYRICIFGSCNGFLLIKFGADFFLWNPSSGFYRKMLAYHRLLVDGQCVTSGLCYDYSTDDYKAVIWLAEQTPDPDYGDQYVVVGGFKINPPKRVHFPYSNNIGSVHRGPVVNGRLHWWVSSRNNNYLIIYFDPVKDEFEELPIPEPIYHSDDYNIILGLGVLGGCLCMARWDNERDIEVLAMKESWNTMFIISNLKINPHWATLEPLCFTRGDGEILMLLMDFWNENKILAYNPGANSHRIIAIPTNYSIDAATYVESFVSLSPEAKSRGQRQRKRKDKNL